MRSREEREQRAEEARETAIDSVGVSDSISTSFLANRFARRSLVQQNMVSHHRGYAETHIGAAAAAELNGLKVAPNKVRRVQYEDDEDEDEEGDGVGLLGSQKL